MLIYADDMLWGVVQIVEKEAWKKSGVLDVYEYDCYGIDWTQYPHFPGKQACSRRGRYHIPGGFENLDVADARGAVTAQFIFRNLHELQGGFLTPKYAEVEGSEGAPRRRYRLLRTLKQKHNTIKAGAVSGLIDGPWQLPQTGTSWVDENSTVQGRVKLDGRTPFIQMNAVSEDDMTLTMWRNRDGDIEVQCGILWGLLDHAREKLEHVYGDLRRLELLNLLNAGETHLEILEAIGERNG